FDSWLDSYMFFSCIVAYHVCLHVCFFFFQAEDGIRDATVTGVQTCALPIYLVANYTRPQPSDRSRSRHNWQQDEFCARSHGRFRSEERRVGKEWRSRWAPCNEKKEKKRRTDIQSDKMRQAEHNTTRNPKCKR